MPLVFFVRSEADTRERGQGDVEELRDFLQSVVVVSGWGRGLEYRSNLEETRPV